ncbi:hypothetical protein [Stutzerimonas nitrititolerans]|uniref:hypothetical protein n=1 Tax=Stutzerimonas nitrititolerans TaxID=2482751 RepID=UPI0028A6428E|nr:hypothetical protein [Stutzerimonas nitrititolerans]
MAITFTADSHSHIVVKEVRAEIDKHDLADGCGDARLALAAELVLAVHDWYKEHAWPYSGPCTELKVIKDQATYAKRVIRDKLGVRITYVKRFHGWVIGLPGTEMDLPLSNRTPQPC